MESVEIKFKMYCLLRKEILQSIRIQQQTFITELIFISIGTLGIISQLGIISTSNFELGILAFIIAPSITLFTTVWLIEQSRIMRAGDFLELLEDEINDEQQKDCLLWENWLRRDDIPFFDVHKIHHYCQIILISSFILLGFYSIYISFGEYQLKFISSIYIAMLVGISIMFIETIQHRYRPYNKESYERFKNIYKKKGENEESEESSGMESTSK